MIGCYYIFVDNIVTLGTIINSRWVSCMVYETERDLLKDIYITRQAMVRAGKLHGLNHPETLKISRQLDDLLNDLYKPENRHLLLLSDRRSQVAGNGVNIGK